MSIKEGKAEIYLGTFFMVMGVLFLALIIPNQIKYVEGAYPQPRFFPDLICALQTVLGVALTVGGYRKHKAKKEGQEEYTFKWKEVRLVMITLGILILYVVSLEFVPYLPATIVATGALITVFGQKKVWKIVLTSALVPSIIYFGMTYGLQVKLP